ncbi:unnamed protein product [Nippostrongylus brasiliensis]|uniref:isopentenyl-diphosphate Delta-isomerase n=1 Tax=Nippostrongylus brasiliensis TaxID=27835 RepID=A0A3P7ANT7_NIPBR|nr:unnamed protein product [Nippostrongylus brasiliensis]
MFLENFRNSILAQKALEKYDPVQVGYLSEQCIAVDESDNIIGGVSKGDAHHVDSMGLHRAFSLFAFTPDRKLILQKRSAEKITFPLLWANTCCSHPLFMETELDGAPGSVRAAVRKIEHELGAVMGDSAWGEHELDYAVVTRDLSLDRLRPNPSEVCDVRAVEEQELSEWVAAEPSSFSPWFLLFHRLRFLSEWWSNLSQIHTHPVDMNICEPGSIMHSIYSRANALFAFMLWVLAAVTFACFLSTAFLDYSAKVEITVNNPRVRSIADYSSSSEKADLGMLDFSITGDFSSTFNWNVKQLFMYLVAEYETPENVMNQVVLWDKIVLRSQRVVLDERRLQSKYYFLDDGTNLLNHPNVTLVLRYNVVPNAGYLRLAQAEGQAIVKFPATYTTKKH